MQNDIRPPQRPPMPSRYARPAPRGRDAHLYPLPSEVVRTETTSVPEKLAAVSLEQTAQPAEASIPSNEPRVDHLLPEVTPSYVAEQLPAAIPEPPKADERDTTSTAPTPPKKRRPFVLILITLLVAGALMAIGSYIWYQSQLAALTSKDEAISQQVKIEPDARSAEIARQLHDKGVIRNELAFNIYLRLTGHHSQLKAGSYILSTHESVPEIVAHLMTGRVDEFSITFYPGAALSSSAPTDSTPSHKEALQEVGYSSEEIETAFTAAYDHPLLADRPAGADLEGYILGDTYRIAAGSSVEEIFMRTFDIYYQRLESAGLIEQIESNDMTMHEVITLASIVQREVADPADQPQVAQVFLSRLEEGMNLGSDVTYQYIADKTGVPRDVNLDSPYNTRRYTGLPPGPIASPGISAIDAVVNPAEGDYLFFLSGDDDVTYFARTVEEHERNIKEHCDVKCSIL